MRDFNMKVETLNVRVDTAYEYDSDDDNDSLYEFSPLDSSLSYSANELPPALEVVPTADMHQIQEAQAGKDSRSSMRNSRQRARYGSPQGEKHISTRHVSGRKIDKKHAQYALSAGMMLGVRECVGGVGGVYEEIDFEDQREEGKSQLTVEEECKRVKNYNFPPGVHVGPSTRTLPYRYKFKAYAPLVFARIRTAFGVDKQRFLHSVCGKNNFIEFMSNAKSGQFFFYSHDGRYMIKTQTQEESRFLRQILPHYYQHLQENPHSFLTHFYGMYRVKMPDLGNKKTLHFLIMKSVFNTEKEIHKIWDLKGSTKGRRAKRGDSVHKDLDIVDEGRKVYVGPEVKFSIMDQLKRDSAFLAKLEIMDYSLLLGVHLRTDERPGVESTESTISGERLSEDSEGVKKKEIMMTNTPCRRRHRENIMLEGKDLHMDLDKVMNGSGIKISASDVTSGDELSMEDSDDDSSSEGAEDRQQRPETPATVSEEEEEATSDICSSISSIAFRDGLDGICPSRVGSGISSWLSPTSVVAMECLSNPYTSREDLGIESLSGDGHKVSREIYFLGIIDILQQYNTRKWGETMMRKAAGNQESQISCVDPVTYADRFVEFISSLLE